jgi:hypothetical protein
MIDVKLNGNTELVKELHNLVIKVNDFIQGPSSDVLIPLVSEDLKREYGVKRIEETARVVLHDNGWFPALSRKFTELFKVFNERYFEGKLPPYTVRVDYSVNHYETAAIWRERKVIKILIASEPRMVYRLLGEMCRLATGDRYDEAWNDEFNRVCVEEGAPDCVRQSNIGMSAEEFIGAASRPTLQEKAAGVSSAAKGVATI